MENGMNPQNQDNTTQPENTRSACAFIRSIPEKLKSSVVETVKNGKKIGKDDPRRIVHAIKVGLALTLVSLFYYLRPLYDGFGQAGMWAILTVVVVFEFTVGGTLSKCINRGCATLLAGALGVGAEYLANLCGEKGEPIVLGLLVFFLGAAATFTRFFPNIKRRYDYGVLIFILTFSLVAVSGVRVTDIVELAHQRLSTIVIGGATCIVLSMFICPVWAGQDLHNQVAGNVEKLAEFLQGFGGEFFNLRGDERSDEGDSAKEEDNAFLQRYKSVLNSKASEESLANFAWWEPGHGGIMFRHPWKQYLKIGALARECACLVEALNGCLNSQSHERVVPELEVKIQEPCVIMSSESGKAMREFASAIKKMNFPSPETESHLKSCKAAADDLKNKLESSTLSPKADLQEIMPLLVVSSVLIDIINCVEKMSSSVQELSQMARFKQPKSNDKQQHLLHRGIVKPVDINDVEGGDRAVVVEIDESGEICEEPPEKKKSIALPTQCVTI